MSHTVQSQEEVFAFLAEAAAEGGGTVQRVDTHAAVLFLAPERVLKVKRAVRFPFLDFSTLDKRKAACTAEIEVNRPFAPEIYRRVVPITREANGTLALDGGGPPVEWAVEMRRFDETLTLDRLAEAGEIDAALADALGRAVAAAHAGAAAIDPAPWIAAVGAYIEEHALAFAECAGVFPPEAARALAQTSRASYARIHPLLLERGQRGLVRRVHGDLHLGNIVLIDGRPILFDAIEFSPLIGSGDVLYDLAFLLMDLVERGLSLAANIVFNRYLAQTRRDQDLDALAALPFFLSMRAAIRAKVTAARLEQAQTEALPAIAAHARQYFDAACRFIAPSPPALVAVGGLSGTGKSQLARALAPELGAAPGAVLLRSDVERKALCGKEEDAPLPDAAYAPEVTARVYAAIMDKARRAVGAGQAAVVDAVFARADERQAMQRSADALGLPLQAVFLTADLETRLARLRGRRGDASDADADVARAQEEYDLRGLDWPLVDAGGTPQETLARVKAALG
jgi:aminoglycoside phosphotransferase family enzyme/predicted kinase